MIGSQLERDKSFMSPRTRKNPAAAAAMVRTALESVRADVRAIYGTNATANKTRLLMMSQEEVEARGAFSTAFSLGHGAFHAPRLSLGSKDPWQPLAEMGVSVVWPALFLG